MKLLGLDPQILDVPLEVMSPLGTAVKVCKMYKDYTIRLENHGLPTNLILLTLK